MAYLAVDKDGTELIFECLPMRRKNLDGSRIIRVFWDIIKVTYSKNQWNKWCNGWSSDETNALPQNGIKLPKGTIEKIIQKKLTWLDEPYNLI